MPPMPDTYSSSVPKSATANFPTNSSMPVPLPSPEFNVPNFGQGGTLFTIATSLVAAILYLRRKVSKDGLEIKADAVQKGYLETLINERDKAMASASEAWRSRAGDAEKIGNLTASVEYLTKLNEDLRKEVKESKEQIIGMRKEMDELRTNINTLVAKHLERRNKD